MREKEYLEWMGKQGFDALLHANCCKIAFNGGWGSRQTEVDELKCELKRINLWYSNVKLQLENKEIDSAIDAKKIDELQKRVDAALKILSSKKKMYVDMVIELEQALKGGEDE